MCDSTFRWVMAFCVVGSCLGWVVPEAQAETLEAVQTERVPSPSAEAQQQFGAVLEVENDFAAVGTAASLSGTSAGLTTYQRGGSDWTTALPVHLETELDGTERFGASVAVGRYSLFVGAPVETSGDTRAAGAVYVFILGEGGWFERVKLTSPNPTRAGSFGAAVEIDAGRLVIGAPGEGAAYVYRQADGAWYKADRLTPPDEDIGHFGETLAFDGATVAVGAPRGGFDNSQETSPVYLFEGGGESWELSQKLAPSDLPRKHFFGRSLALDVESGRLVVGADTYGITDGGRAYVYRETDGSWSRTTELTGPEPESDDGFGRTVGLSGDRMIVSAPDARDRVGRVYLYTRTKTGWDRQAPVQPSKPEAGDRFGSTAAVRGESIIVGAPGDDVEGAADAGSVFEFRTRRVEEGEGDAGDAGRSDADAGPSVEPDVVEEPDTSGGGGRADAGADVGVDGLSDDDAGGGSAGSRAGWRERENGAGGRGCGCRVQGASGPGGLSLGLLLLAGFVSVRRRPSIWGSEQQF